MFVECSGTATGRSPVLEPGSVTHVFMRSPFLDVFLSHRQVDDDGESYWVFESRDVGPIPTLKL